MNTISGIYKITCLKNKKTYIGQATNLEKRIKKHKWMLINNCHFNVHIQRSFNKYGLENFSFEIIEICDESLLDEREKHWNIFYGWPDYNKVFNFESGGHKNKHISIETKMKISKFNKGKKLTNEHKEKLRITKLGKNNPCYGKIYTVEERKKLSELHRKIKPHKNSIEALRNSIEKQQVPILQYDLNENFIKEWPGIQIAARETNSKASLIHKCCNNIRKKHNNYIWKYKKDTLN